MTIADRPPSFIHRYWTGIPLWQRIFAALLLGVIAGILFGPAMESFRWMGDLFIRLIRMLVAPLVLVVIVAGIASIGDPRKLGSMGVLTLFLYAFTTIIAIAIGIALAILIEPGFGVVIAGEGAAAMGDPKSFGQQMLEIVPLNPVQALAETRMLSIIFVAVMLGIGAVLVGDPAEPFVSLFRATSEVLLKLVQLVMELAPFGVFALIAFAVGSDGFSAFLSILKIGLCVAIGSLLHLLFVHGGLVRIVTGLSPVRFLRNISEVIMVGFSTASSAATLPVAMRIATDKLGISQPVVSTVLPLGTTISMDGTGMYIAILCVFATQAFGIPMGFADYALIAVLSLTVAMGAAPIPGSSLFMAAGVLTSVGVPADSAAMVVAFILPFDRPLDMIRTVPNVTSDMSVAVIVAHREGELDRARFNAGGDPDETKA